MGDATVLIRHGLRWGMAVLLAGLTAVHAQAQQPASTPVPTGAPAASQPVAAAIPPQAEITNYWQLISDLTSRIEAAPPRNPSIGRGLDTPTMEYPFDVLRNLRATHLIRAAQEGAAEARSRCAGRSQAECDQLARANVAKALEYLPLISRDPAEGLELFNLLQQKETDPAMRCYILDALAPDAPTQLLLGAWLDRVRNRYEQEYRKTLDLLVPRAHEDPEVLLRALDRCYEWYFRGYQQAWDNDSKVRAAREAGQPIEMSAMLSAHPPEVDSITLKTLREQGAVVSRYAEMVASHIDPLSQRDSRVKEKVRRQLTFIAESVLVPDRDRIRKYLDPSYQPPETKSLTMPGGGGFVVIPVSSGAPGAPPMPVPGIAPVPGIPAGSSDNAAPAPIDSPFGVPMAEPRPNPEENKL